MRSHTTINDRPSIENSPGGSCTPPGVEAAGYQTLTEIREILQHLWDCAALICLEGGPLRYTQLHRKISVITTQHLGDSELTRTRHRLLRHGLIHIGPGKSGANVYTLTDAGLVRVNQLRVLSKIAPELYPVDRTE